MQWILSHVKRFIINAVIDDIKNNGALRQILLNDGITAAASLQRQRSAALSSAATPNETSTQPVTANASMAR